MNDDRKIYLVFKPKISLKNFKTERYFSDTLEHMFFILHLLLDIFK